MKNIILLILAILPVYIILKYIYNKDNEKEPKKLLIKLFLLGMLSCIPAIVLELFFSIFFKEQELLNLTELFLYVLISVAFVEEICKWWVVTRISYNNQEFNETYDAIVYAVFVSLGFALVENIFYVLDGGITIGLFRAITAIPAHAADAIIMGDYLALSKLAEIHNDKKLGKKYLYLSIITPIFVHALYDYFIFTGKIVFIIIFVIYLIYVYSYSIKKIKLLVINNYKFNNNTNKL